MYLTLKGDERNIDSAIDLLGLDTSHPVSEKEDRVVFRVEPDYIASDSAIEKCVDMEVFVTLESHERCGICGDPEPCDLEGHIYPEGQSC